MERPLYWACAAALFLAVPAGAAAEICQAPQQHQQPQQQRPGPPVKGDKPDEHREQPRLKWWVDPQLRTQFSISDSQSALVEQIWQKSTPGLREARARLEKAEELLSQLTRDDSVDEAKVLAQIDVVEQARAEANKRRTVMIYRMNKILTPDQRAKVKAYYERRDSAKHESSR